MSDQSNDFLLRRISDLEGQLTRVNEEARKRRQARKKLQQDFDALASERDALATERDRWKSALEAAPDEWRARHDDLARRVRERDHKDAFRRVAAGAGVRPDAVDDLYALSGYEAEGDRADEQAIGGLIGEAVKARPYLLQTAGEPPAPAPRGAPQAERPRLSVGLDAGRGDPDRCTERLYVRESQLKDPRFTLPNTRALAEASKAGNLVILEG